MKKRNMFIVDGYNVIRSNPEMDRRFNMKPVMGRDALIKHCINWVTSRGDVDDFCVVFDGDSSVCPPTTANPHRQVRAIYSETGETADDRIVKIVSARRNTHRLTVVSDDFQVTRVCGSLGTAILSVSEFCGTLKKSSRSASPSGTKPEEKSDYLSPQMEQAITNSLLKDWNVK